MFGGGPGGCAGGGFGGGGYGGGGFGLGDGFASDAGAQGFGGAMQATQPGLAGFLAADSTNTAGDAGGHEAGGGRVGGKASTQTLTPVTIRMLLESAQELKRAGPLAPDASFRVNGREMGMVTVVACVDSIQQQQMSFYLTLSDGTGKIDCHLYCDESSGPPNCKVLDYVRVFGHLRHWESKENLNVHHVAKVESSNEIAYHGIEVAHVHLAMTGKLIKPAAKPAGPAGAGPSTGGFAMGMSGPPSGGGSFGGNKGGGDTCFKCGGTGHWARDCPGAGKGGMQQPRTQMQEQPMHQQQQQQMFQQQNHQQRPPMQQQQQMPPHMQQQPPQMQQHMPMQQPGMQQQAPPQQGFAGAGFGGTFQQGGPPGGSSGPYGSMPPPQGGGNAGGPYGGGGMFG
eukprot:TRINITY_DN15447_c0_g3_i1.p1 TRINITY_DN15447_c0_g3~~TRINITY_DN15447_c0_g3_i1.p1  ORF type:complete len:408 (+),score=95.56 TRINITY_DN15447_c0_g3_i1:36-1226(+)